MMIVGALLTPFLALPIDLIRNDVPLNYAAIAAYLSPGMVAKVFSAALSYGIITFLKSETVRVRHPEQA